MWDPTNNPQQFSLWTKYTIEPPLRLMEPSNNLPLIEAWLLSLEPSNKVHPLFDNWVTFLLHLRGSRLLCSIFEDFIDMVKLKAWLWYHVRNHKPPQWYDVVHFDNRDIFLTYKPTIIFLISQCGTPHQQSSTILPLNQVYHKTSPNAYGALEQPPIRWGSTPFFGALEQSTPFVRQLSHFFTTSLKLPISLFDI